MKWMRMRFEANEADYRPIKWPPPGPYWCSGYLCGAVGAAIVVAFIPLDDSTPARDRCSTAEKIVIEFWPEAKNLGLTKSISLRDSPARAGGTRNYRRCAKILATCPVKIRNINLPFS